MSRNTPDPTTSRTHRWIQEQHNFLEDDPRKPAAATPPHPYLAYPQFSATSLAASSRYDLATISSRGHEEQPPSGRTPPPTDAMQHKESRNPLKPRRSVRPVAVQNIFNSASPLRNLLSPRRATAQAVHPQPPVLAVSPPPQNEELSQRSSLSTIHAMQRSSNGFAASDPSASPPETPTKARPGPRLPSHMQAHSGSGSQHSWQSRSASAASKFSAPGPPPEDGSSSYSPRPSTSSTGTHSSTAYTSPASSEFSARKALRSPSTTTIFSSSPSLWSLPTDASHLHDPPESTAVIAPAAPATWRPAASGGAASLGSVAAGLLTSPRARRKRKLIISGLRPHDERRFDAVRRWCETFGELSSITRVPNGDLHVDFRKAEVAETVCRLNARVHITGVGSVCLSWFTGKRP